MCRSTLLIVIVVISIWSVDGSGKGGDEFGLKWDGDKEMEAEENMTLEGDESNEK
ncbi:unnamed protein product, partial [Anisakis simplex]|uniref:Uncharacterized protein n=1 Tax=Anisakis simplex TaxID=6269 RepID=A0A0M3JBU2_ANISI